MPSAIAGPFECYCTAVLASQVTSLAYSPPDRGRNGRVAALEFEARRWKREIFSVMLERGLEPDGLVRIFEEPLLAF